ncbi:MAG TPA: LysM peptidoglycan-binding domain-containing M23 family metallopeptidase [Acidimicrobiia bacterium]|nr:LysM peptidoglycan-binding domain-containing M23 family metallopeptidase [Acidimicrobiia bacterium]
MDAVPKLRRHRVLASALIVALAVAAASADYVVESGDTLGDIARAHGVSVEEIADANGIANPDLIRVGQVLVIPGTQGGGGSALHVVAPGDTLAGIAARFGTTIGELVETNQLADPDLLRIGQELAVPTSGATEAAPAPASAQSHTVVAGETLAGIASRYGIALEALAAANGITDPSLIYVGTTLRLAGPVAPEVAVTPASTVHVVSAGESLNSVAARYGTSVSQLVTTNGLADPNLIRVGQELTVPGGGVSAWVCPVPGAVFYNDWGFPRSGGRFHEGNDLFADRGTPVVAPVSGALQVKNGPVGGLQFRLYGDDGVTYIGSHLDSAIESQYVTAGTPIGGVGDSGNAIGANPHLHFEMHPDDGLSVNPYPVLKTAGC